VIDVITDLDGVLYLGDTVIDGVPRALGRAIDSGCRLTFVTNNSTRTADQVAAKIHRLTGHDVAPEQVCTSSMAAVGLLGPEDGPVLVVGEEGITVTLEESGFSVTDDPMLARSVVVGLTRDFGYDRLADAADAVRRGSRFIATNVDPTYPISGRLLPGAGAMVAAIATASGVSPLIAGKPHPPMIDLIRRRTTGRGWVIGDRADTDVALAHASEDWTSILVLTGVTADGKQDVADHVVDDFAAAIELVLETAERR
jgi:HAD superfamily hydrolase (TIGR01450 family)